MNLFFLTDTFPYGKGEDFILNEIKYLEKSFEKIYIIPVGLMVDVNVKKSFNHYDNIVVLSPPNQRNLYTKDKVRLLDKILWSIKYLTFPLFECLFNKDLYVEFLGVGKKRTYKHLIVILKELLPRIKSRNYFRKQISEDMFCEENIVYSFWFDYSISMFQDILKANHICANIKYVARGHRRDIYENENSLNYLPFRKKYFESLNLLCLSTKDGFFYMQNKYEKYINKLEMIHLGTEDHGYKVNRYNNTCFHIVSCSFCSPVKRVDLIIKALSKLNSTKKIKWTHIGYGIMFNELNKMCKLNLKDKIDYEFIGYLKNQDMIKFYQTHNINLFINVSSSEGLPVSIQEAISFAIPVIATNVGSTQEAVINNYNGLLLNKDFLIEDLTKNIKNFIDMEKEEYNKFCENSRKLWEEEHCAKQNYEKFIRRIKKI